MCSAGDVAGRRALDGLEWETFALDDAALPDFLADDARVLDAGLLLVVDEGARELLEELEDGAALPSDGSRNSR